MAVALHAAADDLAFQHVERGEQAGGAMPLIVVGHRPAAALLHRQAGLGAVERLDLRFLIDRQHQAVGRRIEIQPDHVAQLGGKGWILRQLEAPHPMRQQTVGGPDALHRAQ